MIFIFSLYSKRILISKIIFLCVNNMISVTFDSVFYTIVLLAYTLMSFGGGSSHGINYHVIELKSASICVSKIWRLKPSEIFRARQFACDSRWSNRDACYGSPWRVCRDEMLFTYIANKIPCDDDIRIYLGNIKKTGIILNIIKRIYFCLIQRPSSNRLLYGKHIIKNIFFLK